MTDAELIQRAIAKYITAERSPAEVLGVPAAIVNGLHAMGLAARERGQPVMADNIFRRCVMLDPFRADFWIAFAAARQALGRALEAGELYQVAAVMTDDPAPIAYAAACFAEAGQPERARSLAAFVRGRGQRVDELEAWLAFAEAA
jgi:hypothetical protein